MQFLTINEEKGVALIHIITNLETADHEVRS